MPDSFEEYVEEQVSALNLTKREDRRHLGDIIVVCLERGRSDLCRDIATALLSS
jgi:formylmethanofuran dehydrogenase subunit C